MTDNGGVSSRASGITALISNLRLNVADGGSFRNFADWKNIADRYGSLAAGEDVLSGVGSFSCEEVLSLLLVFIGVSEVDLDERAASSGIVEDSSNNTSDVSLALSEVQVTVSWGRNSFRFGGSVATTLLAFTLASDDFTHLSQKK